MGTEIERKFIVIGDAWTAHVRDVVRIRQAYVAIGDATSVRVRIADNGSAWLTIKSAEAGHSRREFEYPIPVQDAEALFEMRIGAVVSKTRHRVPAGALIWEIDVFDGENTGLVIAEIELPAADQPLNLPSWIGPEVTGERRYYNADLALVPYTRWAEPRLQ